MIQLPDFFKQERSFSLFRVRQFWFWVGLAMAAVIGIILFANPLKNGKRQQVAEPEISTTVIFGSLPFSENSFLGGSTSPLSCGQYPSLESQDTCRQNYALQTEDVASCSAIKILTPFVSKDACMNLLAQKTKNAELCAKIVSQEIKENCLEMAKK